MQEFGRAMFFMAKVPSDGAHWDMIQSDTTNTGTGEHWEIGGTRGKYELTVDGPDDGRDSATVIPSGAWFCVQWTFKGTGTNTEYHVKMNGKEGLS
jgi:hypothetical protein